MITEITNLDEYYNALSILEKIFDAKPNTKEGEELLELVKLIEDWENKQYPFNNI